MSRFIRSRYWVCLFVAPLIGACATLVSGTRQKIQVYSNPTDADVYIDRLEAGRTPLDTAVERSNPHTVRLAKEGYVDETILLSRSANPVMLANIVFGGIVGILIDLKTGAAFKLSPEEINATLEPVGGGNRSIDTRADGASPMPPPAWMTDDREARPAGE